MAWDNLFQNPEQLKYCVKEWTIKEELGSYCPRRELRISLTIMTKLHNFKEKCVHIALTLQSPGKRFYAQEEL